MKRYVTIVFHDMPQKPDFTAFAVSGTFLHANSLDLVKISLHSFCLPISYMFVTFRKAFLNVRACEGYNIRVKDILVTYVTLNICKKGEIWLFRSYEMTSRR